MCVIHASLGAECIYLYTLFGDKQSQLPRSPHVFPCKSTHTHARMHMFRQYFVSKGQHTGFLHSKCSELCERERSAGNCHLLVPANKFSHLTKKARCKRSGILPGSHLRTPISPELLQHMNPAGTAQHFGLSCVTCPSSTHSINKGVANLHIPVHDACRFHVMWVLVSAAPFPQLRRHSLPMPRPRYLRSRSFPGLCCLLVEEAAAAALAPR